MEEQPEYPLDMKERRKKREDCFKQTEAFFQIYNTFWSSIDPEILNRNLPIVRNP